jgi:hypothetical protein
MLLNAGFCDLMVSEAAGDDVAAEALIEAATTLSLGRLRGVFGGDGVADVRNGHDIHQARTVTVEHLRGVRDIMADPLPEEPPGTVPSAGPVVAAETGFDRTFTPAKSVSMAWAPADESTRRVIYASHRRVVQFVLAYAVRDVFHSRSEANGVVQEDVENLIAAAFIPLDNRAADT